MNVGIGGGPYRSRFSWTWCLVWYYLRVGCTGMVLGIRCNYVRMVVLMKREV